MAIKVGTFTQKTSTGTQAITGLGFIPQIILFFSSGATASGSYQDHFNAMFGMATAADAGSVSCSSEDNKTTGIHNTTGRAAQKAITICEFGEVTKAEADLDSFDADGFTLDWTTADATARIINYIAVSGFDNVKIVEWKMTAGTGNQSITGVGFIPDAVINIHEFNKLNAATPHINATGGIGIGAFTADDEWGLGTLDTDSSDTPNLSAESITSLFQSPSVSGSRKTSSFVSMDADGFTINVSTGNTPLSRMYSLCLKGGPQVKVGSMVKPSNVQGAIEETINFRLGGLILTSTDQGSIPSISSDSVISVGVVDRDSQHSMEFFSDSLATSNTAMVNIIGRGILRNTNHDATIETQGFASYFSENVFRVNFGTATNPAFNFNYIAFEETVRTGDPLVINTGVFDKKTSNGSQSISGIGFTPKVLMCWYGGATADDTWQDFLRRGFGAATSATNRYACGDAAEEDLATSNCQVIKSPAHIITIVDPSGSLEGEADLTSFDSDGFTLEWTNANATAYKIHYLALGGDEVEEAKIISFVTSLSLGNQSVTGVGFRPDTIICFYNTRINSQEDGVHVHGAIGLALTDGLNHVGAQNFLLDASATENHSRTTDIDGFIEGCGSAPSEDLHSTFKTMDDDGFTFDQLNAAPSPGYRIFALCIKGVLTKVGNYRSEVSTTGDKAYTGIGMQPIGLLQIGTTQAVDDSLATRGIYNIGCADGTNSNAMMSGAERGIGDLACLSKVGALVAIDTTDPMAALATTEEGTLTSFDSDGFTIDWVTSDANAVRNLFMAFEQTMSEAEGGPEPSVSMRADNTLVLTHGTVAALVLFRSASTALGLTQDARSSIFAKSGASALGLSQLVQQTISFRDVFTPSVQNTLVLTQEAVLRNRISASASNILSLSHLVTNDSIKSHSASSTLALVQVLAENFVLASAANALSLTQSAGSGKNVLESASNVMVLAQTVAENFKLASASNALVLAQSASAAVDINILIATSNTFTLSQTLSQTIDHSQRIPFNSLDDQALLQLVQTVSVARNLRETTSNTLALVGDVRLKEHNEAIQSFISLSQIMGRALSVSAASSLALQQEASRIFKLASHLNLISSVSQSKGRDANTVIPFVQLATVLSDFARLVTQDLGIRQSVSFINESTFNVECTYSPFVGDVTSGITPPPTDAPTLGSATLTLTWPFVEPTTTLVLRNPELNNSERFQFARINRTTRGGDLKIFSDPTWPKQETLKVQIEALTSAQKDSLVSFFEDNIGLEIGLLDDEDRQWKGLITQPDADITDVNGDGCTYSIIFEFEGELQ